jgi:hypothetical protein
VRQVARRCKESASGVLRQQLPTFRLQAATHHIGEHAQQAGQLDLEADGLVKDVDVAAHLLAEQRSHEIDPIASPSLLERDELDLCQLLPELPERLFDSPPCLVLGERMRKRQDNGLVHVRLSIHGMTQDAALRDAAVGSGAGRRFGDASGPSSERK